MTVLSGDSRALAAIRRGRILPILRLRDQGRAVAIAETLAAGLVPLPGTWTATEVVTARAAGAPAVKLFPAGPAGTAHLKALLGPFPDLAAVPTGGITVDQVQAWLAAGAIAVGLGSDLVPVSGSLEGLAERAARAVSLARQ